MICPVLATLASLRIRNLALVEDLTWQPGAGLVAITGETGAGKSLLIGALQLLLGERADKSLIRAGADSCTVEAVFEVGETRELDVWLEEQGAEACAEGELLLKRTLSSTGAGRQFINGSACTLAALKLLGDRLVDLHGPHDHQSLFSREAQTRVLDAYAGAAQVAADFAAAHREQSRLAGEIERLRGLEHDAAMRREMLAHAAKEITEAKLRPGEEEEVMSRLRAAGNSQRLIELGAQMESALGVDGDGGVRTALAEAVRAARELARLDDGAAGLLESLEEVAGRLADLEGEARRYAEKIEADPATLRELESRADLLQSLKRKYGGSLEEVMARGEQAAKDLEDIETRGEKIAALEKEQASAATKAARLAKSLSAARAKAAPSLAKAVTKELRELGFLRAEFGVQLEPLPEARPLGAELAEFEFAPNPGEPAKPLRAIASSGEISRVMLALKSVLAGQDGVPLLVFDEIDANVGGEVAVKVGQKMRALSRAHQVLCITHLPQVAAAAHRQFAVTKEFDGQRTSTAVGELRENERVAELARMLGGQASDSAVAHARSLLAAAG
jgi:DNA repair protein RecN (Recombination protein N)